MEFKKQEIEILISKYLENKCTPEEKHRIVELLSGSIREKSLEEELLSQLNNFQEGEFKNHSADFEKIYYELIAEIQRRETRIIKERILQRRKRIRRLVINSISVAAVVFVSFFLGTIFNRDRDSVIAGAPPAVPGHVEIIAPLGSKSVIKLNDGTEIMLNAGSSVSYSSNYNEVNRNLTLDGEAYFKVATNENLPLVVDAGNINIKATGTEFNVKAYSGESFIETTLVDGEVEISQKGNTDKDRVLILKPHQKAIYASQNDQLTLQKIKEIEPQAVKPAKIDTEDILVSLKTDVEQVTAWTKNKLIIKKENLESLCTKLQRKYDVNFIFGDEEIKKHRFSGVLLDETFQQVMDVIKLTAPVDYLIDGKTVVLYSNKEKSEK